MLHHFFHPESPAHTSNGIGWGGVGLGGDDDILLHLHTCSKRCAMDCFGTYFTHVQTCNVTRVQSATEWTASVHTLHMSKPVMQPVFKVLRNGPLRYILYTCPQSIVRNLTTCTHGAHKIHSCKNKGVHTAKISKTIPRVQTRPLAACTDEAPDRVYRRGRYPCDPGQNHLRVLATLAQNHPRVLATPESACTADPLTIQNHHTIANTFLVLFFLIITTINHQ